MTRFKLTFVAITLSTLIAIGCSGKKSADSDASADATPIDGKPYLLPSEPDGALNVIKARELAKNDDDIVVVGRIGGKRDPWLKGRAMFLIADSSLKSCDQIEGDTCKTPWDYCCASNLSTSLATVQIVDDKGDIVKAGAKELLNVKELQTVVVVGKAKLIEGGNLIILAKGVYVRK